MDEQPIVRDCPECHGPRTVFFGVCAICFAELDEWHLDDREGTADVA